MWFDRHLFIYRKESAESSAEMRKTMAITTYAAIDVGSSELCMKIYELSRQGGIRELTYVRHRLSLGTETYTKGFISYQTTNEICNTLNDFKRIISEFNADSYEVYATSALREAKNVLVIIDGQLFLGAAEDAAGKILLENDLVAVHINLNVTVDVDAQGAAQLYGENDAAEVVNFSYDTGRFHGTVPP